jgi:predicted component of viral defense system (DUF524 family)
MMRRKFIFECILTACRNKDVAMVYEYFKLHSQLEGNHGNCNNNKVRGKVSKMGRFRIKKQL